MFFALKVKSILESSVDMGQNLINNVPIIGSILKLDDYVKTKILWIYSILLKIDNKYLKDFHMI